MRIEPDTRRLDWSEYYRPDAPTLPPEEPTVPPPDEPPPDEPITFEPPAYEPPPDEPPPDAPPTEALPGRNWANIALTAGIVVLAIALLLGGWFMVRARLGGSPATQPSPQTIPVTSPQPAPTTSVEPKALAWSAPLPLGSIGNTNPSVMESGVDGIVLVQEWTGLIGTVHISVAAVDLSTMTVLWSKPDTLVWAGQQAINTGEPIPVDGGGVLLAELDPTATSGDSGYAGFDLVDQRTGKVLWHAAHKDTSVLAFGNGYLVTQNRSDGKVCTSKVSSPGKCIWQAPGWDITRGCFGDIIIGGGAWLVTATGVLDMATGAKAPFGGDAHSSCTSTDNVFYAGPSKDKILRVEYLNNGASIAIQMWDTEADAPLGPPMPVVASGSSKFFMDSETPIFIETNAGSIIAFAWGSGQRQWQVLDPYAASSFTTGMGEIAGRTLLWGTAGNNPGAPVAAFDIADGHTVWSIDAIGLLPFTGYSARTASGDVCYLQNGSSLFAVNIGNGNAFGSVPLPAGVDATVGVTSFLGVVGNRVIAISPNSELYVLQS